MNRIDKIRGRTSYANVNRMLSLCKFLGKTDTHTHFVIHDLSNRIVSQNKAKVTLFVTLFGVFLSKERNFEFYFKSLLLGNSSETRF